MFIWQTQKATHLGSIFSNSVTILYTLLADSQFFEHFCRRAVVLLVLKRPSARLFRPFEIERVRKFNFVSSLSNLMLLFFILFNTQWALLTMSQARIHSGCLVDVKKIQKCTEENKFEKKIINFKV